MVHISGWGAVTAFGEGLEALRAGMARAETAICPVSRFDSTPMRSAPAALVPGYDTPPLGIDADPRVAEMVVQFAVRAGEEAVQMSGVRDRVQPERIALVLGTNAEDRPTDYASMLRSIGDRLQALGPRIMVSIACASSTAALGVARDLLLRGDADAVITGGSDCITPRVMAGFSVLGALSEGPSRPFSTPAGMSLGDGAGMLVLERAATSDTALLGWGLAGDAHHATAPAPDGSGVSAALHAALADADLGPERVDYVNAHGTGTVANDEAEWIGLSRVLDPHTPCSSSKGLFGHTQGAAGALEVIVTLDARSRGVLPPTWGFDEPRPGAPHDPVPVDRPGRIDNFASSNAAFGGTNAVVVVGAGKPITRQPQAVYLAHANAVGPHGVDLPTSFQLGRAHRHLIGQTVRRVDCTRMDRTTAFMTAAVRGGMRGASLRIRRGDRHRVALIAGQAAVSQSSAKALQDSIDSRGLAHLHAGSFARTLLVSPVGAVSRAFDLRGPINAVSAGRASGLLALIHAAELLQRPELLTAIATSADEWWMPGSGLSEEEAVHKRIEEQLTAWEGAACAVLQRTPTACRVAGWALGPDAAERAMQRSGLNSVARTIGDHPGADPVIDGTIASSGLLAVALGWQSSSCLVVATEPGVLSAAVVLTTEAAHAG